MVRQELEQVGLTVLDVGLGRANVVLPESHPPSAAMLQARLRPLGFDLLEDSRDQVVEQVKAAIVEMVHYPPWKSGRC